MSWKYRSEIRGPGLLGQPATLEYRALETGQPLVLTREPTNRADPNAVIALTIVCQPCGYVAKEHAAIIAPDMDRGVLWLCRVTAAPSAMTKPQVILWQSRGQERSFRLDAIEWHASTIMVDAIMAGRWLRGRPDEDAA